MTFDEMRKLAGGYQPAKLFLTAVRVGIFDELGEGPRRADVLAKALGLDARATSIVCDGLAALGLLSKAGDDYSNSPEAARYLVRKSADYRGSVINHMNAGWEDWADLEATLRTGVARCQRKEKELPSDEEGLRDFILGMENITRDIAAKIAELLPLEGKKAVIDLGGGPGNYALAFARRAPGAKVYHFDLPRTSQVAREFIAGREEGGRIEFIEGDLLSDPLGGSYDLIFISQVLHMFGEPEVQKVVELCSKHLSSGGVLAVHEHFLDDAKTSPAPSALFSVHMLAVTKSGRGYSFSEIEGYMSRAGITPDRRIPVDGTPSRLLLGVKR